MTHRLSLGALIVTALLVVPACGGQASEGNGTGASLPTVAAPEGQRWSQIAERVEGGGVLIGNPNAPVKVIEFASLTCPHCATFAAASSKSLKSDFIDSGRVSVEFRNILLNPIDAMAAAVTHCVATERFFPLTEAVFARQSELFKELQSNQEEAQAASSLPPEQRYVAMARVLKIDQLFQSLGVPGDVVTQCLSDIDNIEKLQKVATDSVNQYGVPGTPAFVINGELLTGVGTWPALRSRLEQYGGG